MIKRQLGLAALVTLGLCVGSFAIGKQAASQKASESEGKAMALTFAVTVNKTIGELKASGASEDELEKAGAKHPKPLKELFEAVAADPESSSFAADIWLNAAIDESSKAKSAAQVSQVTGEKALLMQSLAISQNARIIELLTKIANQRQSSK